MMKTLKMALVYWLAEGRECNGDDFVFWCFCSSLILLLAGGFAVLLWLYPIIAAAAFVVVLLPIFVQIYLKFNPEVLDSHTAELAKHEHKRK